MAKTAFPSSPPFGIITPALQSAWWGTSESSGHDHKGNNSDGSCPKIALSDSVSDFVSESFEAKITTAFKDTSDIIFDIDYFILGGSLVFLRFPAVTFDWSGTQYGGFDIVPTTSLPSGILNSTDYFYQPFAVLENTSQYENGIIILPNTSSLKFTVKRYSSSFLFNEIRGILPNTVCYIKQ